MNAKKILSLIISATIFFTTSQTFARENSKQAEISDAVQKTVKKLENKPQISFEARYFSFGADANLNTSKVNLNGGELNLKRNLQVVDDKAAEFIFRYKNFSIDYLRMNKQSDANLAADNLKIGGKNFSGDISAKNNLHYIKLNVDNEIISLMGTGANWSYGLTGIYWRGNANNTSDSSGQNYFVAVPTVGFGIYMAIMPKMTVYTQISGIFLGGRGHLGDFESGLKYSPSKNFSMTAGFRSIEFNLNRKGDGDFKMNGPFIGLRSDF